MGEEYSNYWNYFLLIDKDLMNTNRYVQHTENNLKVFSSEFARIILVSCAEIDTICRLICKKIDTKCNFFDDSVRSGDIREYSKIILEKYPKLTSTEIEFTTLQLNMKPWDEWSIKPKYNTPVWWREYQLLKHYRHLHFEKATLENALFSTSALFVLLLYLHKINFGFTVDEKNVEYPDCFFSQSLLDINGDSLDKKFDAKGQLPDFEY